uniref:VWA domain-containing protein n=1 Tax=Fervidicoccus fontis TaxID=683846 RepID=A0A7J3ZJC2_9CREN
MRSDSKELNEKLVNNLLNVTVEDPIFKSLVRIVRYRLPEDYREVFDKSVQLGLLAADSFFLHYSVCPLIRSKNTDRILEAARMLMLMYMNSEEFVRTRKSTVLDEDSSMIHAIELTKAMIEYLMKYVQGGLGKGRSRAEARGSTAKGQGRAREPASPYDIVQDEGNREHVGTRQPVPDERELEGILERHLEEALLYAIGKAGSLAWFSKTIKEVMGLRGAGLHEGIYEKLIDLSSYLMEVRDAQVILELARSTLESAPRNLHIRKERDERGESIRGYFISKKIERALARELAMPDEVFNAKLAGEGFLAREKETVKEGALYVLLDKCLPEGTRVLMSDGSMLPVEDVREGEEVLSVKITPCLQTGTLLPTSTSRIEVRVEGARVARKVCSGIQPIYKLITTRGTLKATANHVIPVIRRGVAIEVPLALAKPGDIVLYNGRGLAESTKEVKPEESDISQAAVVGVRSTGQSARTYDLTLEKNHYFIADGIVVHNSGSMNGFKLIWSRSVALVLYRLSLARKLNFKLRMFDTRVYPESTPLEDPLEILDAILKVPASGGTRISASLERAVEDIVKDRLTSKSNTIVLITDGEDNVVFAKQPLKKNNITLITVMVGGENEVLRSLSDVYVKVTPDRDGALQIVRLTDASFYKQHSHS